MRSMTRPKVLWPTLIVVAIVTLVVAETAERPVLTHAGRVHQLAEDFACPVCDGQSVAESDVPIARTIRLSIASMVDGGATDDDIRTMLVARFGEDIDYTPDGRGWASLVWVLPIVAASLGVVFAAISVHRWQHGLTNSQKLVKPLILGVVSVLAVLAGLFVAQLSGSRGLGDSLSGEIRSSTRSLLIEAGVSSTGDAISIYTQVLDLQPSNTEALAYRGWAYRRDGNLEAAMTDLDAAVQIDPSFPDARVFRSSLLLLNDEPARAAEDLVTLDTLQAPPIVGDLLSATRLRERIASTLVEKGSLVLALDLLRSGLAVAPGSAGLLAERGWLLALSGEADLVDIGVTSLNEAVATDPLNPYALAYRAVVRLAIFGDRAGAESDVAEFGLLILQPSELVALLKSEGLGTH